MEVTVAATWLRSRRARHSAIAGRRIAAPGLAPSPEGGVGGSSARRAPFSPAAGAGAAGAGSAGAALLNSSPLLTRLLEAPAGLVRTKPRCTLQALDVAIEVAQHFEKIVVNSVFCEVWFCRD